MTKYQAIACGLHSQYELVIMYKKSLLLQWKTKDNIKHKESIKPIDLVTHNHAEFLIIEHADGRQEKVQLDHILSFNLNP